MAGIVCRPVPGKRVVYGVCRKSAGRSRRIHPAGSGVCVACHTDIDNDGAYLAGGRAFETPFGTFYSPNITPDVQTGIGDWTEAQLAAALTRGVGPNGDHYYPVFPYTTYTRMRSADIKMLFGYLRTVPVVNAPRRDHELKWFMRFRIVNWFWKLLFFKPGNPPSDRGEYLVKALGHCDECHTPRSLVGALDYQRHLTGNKNGPEGNPVPNITPDRETGIGRWGRSDLIRYLRNGVLPDGDFAGGLMVEVVDDGLSYLTRSDTEAIADYLRSLKPFHSPAEE